VERASSPRRPELELIREHGDDGEIEFRLCGKRYVLPAEDVVLLPLDNIIVENLAVEFARRVVERLGSALARGVVSGIQVDVCEAHGQGGSYTWTFAPDSPDSSDA
jgi:6-pyruvoyltetrahydropterin/6-carboxytetrahydropterin synthase